MEKRNQTLTALLAAFVLVMPSTLLSALDTSETSYSRIARRVQYIAERIYPRMSVQNTEASRKQPQTEEGTFPRVQQEQKGLMQETVKLKDLPKKLTAAIKEAGIEIPFATKDKVGGKGLIKLKQNALLAHQEVVPTSGPAVVRITTTKQPHILEATIDPLDVKVGDVQKMAVWTRSLQSIKDVRAEIEHDLGIDTVSLALAQGTAQEGTWTGEWVVHSTHSAMYQTTFVATDVGGRENKVVLAWTDPCSPPASGNWTIDANCSITGVNGVDNGNFVLNGDYTLTIQSGATWAFNSGQQITKSSGSIAIVSGGQVKKTNLWMVDADTDGYPATTTQVAQDSSPGGTYRRRNLLSSLTTTDCSDNTYSVSNSCLPGVPQSFGVSAGSGQASLSWSAPSSNGGLSITNYKVYRGTSSGGESLLTTLGAVTNHTDTGLSNGTTYYYKVSAVNAAGEGSLSTEVSGTPYTTPSAPQGVYNVSGSGYNSLGWSAPASNGGASITGYKVYRSTISGAEGLYATLGVTTSYYDAGVSNGTTYYYKVSAVNAAGEGSLSTEVSGTPYTTPSTPQNLAGGIYAETGGCNCWYLLLNWSAPYNGGSAISYYKVYVVGVWNNTWPGSTPSGSATSTRLNYINPTTHSIQLSAVNAAGEGPQASTTVYVQ